MYCARLVPVLEQVLEAFPEKVKVVYKNFPLRSHKFATQAAVAAHAAGAQGKFWAFHDLLFDNYNKLDDKKVLEIATELKLDMAAFEKEKKNPSVLARIRKDAQDGVKADVRGTPTVFINGRLVNQRTLSGFRTVIDKMLEDLAGRAKNN